MDQKIHKDLCRMGLSSVEAQVYLSTLRLGGSFASTIAKQAGIERTNCYHTLKALGNQGLISCASKRGRKYYLAESPKRFLSESVSRMQLAEQLVPQLSAIENTGSVRAPKVRYFEGLEGLQRVLFSSLESSSEILRYSNIQLLCKKFPEALSQYCVQLADKQQRTRIISSYEQHTESFLQDVFPDDYIRRYVQLLYVNPREFHLENEVSIFDDKVSIISLNPEEQIAVIIESQVYADTSRTTFELAWLGATRFDVR